VNLDREKYREMLRSRDVVADVILDGFSMLDDDMFEDLIMNYICLKVTIKYV
jgi:hypothetical protein